MDDSERYEKYAEKEMEQFRIFQQDPVKRKQFCERIYDKVFRSFPTSLIPALDFLIKNYDVEKSSKRGIFIEGAIIKKVKASKSGFVLKFASSSYYIRQKNESGCYLEVTIKINPDESPLTVGQARLVYRMPGEQSTKLTINAKKGFFFFKYLKSMPLINLAGLEILKIYSKRTIYVENKLVYIKRKFRGEFVLHFFNRGRHYFFDLYGYLVGISNSLRETKSQYIEDKIQAFERKLINFDSGKCFDDAEGQLIKSWLSNPHEYDGQGLTAIIEGSIERDMLKSGEINFEHLVGAKRKSRFFVRSNSSGRINLSFKGPVVFFLDGSGKKLNAFETKGLAILCHKIRQMPSEMKYLRLRNIDLTRKTVSLSTRNRICKFYIEDLSRIAGGINDKQLAILVDNRGGVEIERFYLLILRDGCVSKIPVSPASMARKR